MASVSAKKSVSAKVIANKSVPKKTPPAPSSSSSSSSYNITSSKSSPSKKQLDANETGTTNNTPTVAKKSLPFENSLSDSFISLPPCAHLSKVLNSNSKDAVLKAYSAGMNVVIVGLHSNDTGLESDLSISRFKNKNNRSILNYYNRKGQKISVSTLQKARSKILFCKECNDLNLKQHNSLFMCLQCTNIGCWTEKHAYNHAKSTGHVFGINANNGELLCVKCGDLVAHPSLENIRYNSLKNSGLLEDFQGLPYFQIDHNTKNRELINKSTSIPSFKETTGLRGFINLGSTCFMSSVLQTLIHNPFLKRYYLSGLHSDCPKNHSECMSCCLNDIFQDFFTNPAIIGYGLTSFIEAAWKVKRTLAGYSEQDSHEFWQFLIHQIHKNDTTSSKYIKNKESTPTFENNKLKVSDEFNCDCIIHKIFSGSLESTLTCTVCGKNRKIEDPMLDLSLEIQDKHNNEKISLTDLHSCFRKYTRIEELDVLYECTSCNKKTKVTKSLRLKKLPPILSIQLKRFEHIGVSSKIDYHISIPSILDIKDYVSYSSISNQITIYQLFAVICHLGNVNTGHYLAYVKNSNGIWFKFDDATITRISEEDVKKVNAYMVLYCINKYM